MYQTVLCETTENQDLLTIKLLQGPRLRALSILCDSLYSSSVIITRVLT